MDDGASISVGHVEEAEAPGLNPEAQRAIDELSEQIRRSMFTPDAPKLLKQVFCRVLGWEYVNQPIPLCALPQSDREDVAEAVIVARRDELRLCYVRLAVIDLLIKDQQTSMDRLAGAWPTVWVAFSNFARDQIDFCQKAADGRLVRLTLDRNLPGALELARSVYALGAFEVKIGKRAPRLRATEKLERKLGRRRRVPRGLDLGPISREIERQQSLTAKEEQALRRQIEPGKRNAARDKLILANLRLVVEMAWAHRNRCSSLDDRVQEGVRGLMRAVERFGPERRIRFRSFAGRWVVHAIHQRAIDRSRMVWVPPFWAGQIKRFRRFYNDFVQDHGFEPNDEELRESLGLSAAGLRKLRQALAAWDGPVALRADIPCEVYQSPMDDAAAKRREAIEEVIASRLDRRSATIIRRRFGLDGTPEQTLEQLGRRFRITREAVRQIEKRAIEILKHPQQARRLQLFVP